MVVDDIENDAEAERMRTVDEPAHVVRSAVEAGRGEPIDAVISPAEPSREFGEGHDLDDRHAECREGRQLSESGGPGALSGEGSDVQFVENLANAVDPAPRRVGPLEKSRVHD